jgi:hypothetical protein
MTARPRPARALADTLDALASVVRTTTDALYVSRPHDRVSGSIGAHVRHAIDHVAALVDGRGPGIIDYDTRRRGTEIERDREGAVRELTRLSDTLRRWTPLDDRVATHVSADVDSSGARVVYASTVGRELVFVLSHTVHHQAIIALLLASAGVSTPERFGVAPSTPSIVPAARVQEPLSCARSA